MHETTLGIVRNLDLEALLETLIERAQGLAGGNSAFIYLPRPGGEVIERRYYTSIFPGLQSSVLRRGEGLAGKIWQTAEPMIVEDYRSWKGRAVSFADHPLGPALGVPLKSGSEVTGIIGVTRPPGSSPFQKEELDLMIRFAQLASIALDNARLHTSLRQELAERRRAEAELQKAYQTLERRVSERTRELQILNSIAAAVNRSLNLREVFQYAIDTTGDALGLEVGAAFRLDEETALGPDPPLTLLAHRGLSAEFLPFVEHLPLRGSMIEETLPEGGPLAWTPSEYRLEPVRQALVQEGLAFGISVPFVAQGRLLGAMMLGSRKERFMSPEELSLLESIGQEVSMAVKNARLYDRAQQMAALEERNRLAQELHDSVTQSLYSLTLYAEAAARMLEAGKSKKATDQLRELGDTAREALQEMRLLIFELKPLDLQKAELADAIRSRLDAVALPGQRGGGRYPGADLRKIGYNEDQARKDEADRKAIVESLKEKLKCGDKSLVGNKGYRRYLKSAGKQHFTIDQAKLAAEQRFDGMWVLRTNTSFPAAEVAVEYKQLWMVESIFRTAKSLLETRPIYHKVDDTIRGHVFCSFLALVLRKELETRLERQGQKLEWADINTDLRALQEVEVEMHGKTLYLRTDLRGVCHTVLQAAGVAAPPTLRE